MTNPTLVEVNYANFIYMGNFEAQASYSDLSSYAWMVVMDGKKWHTFETLNDEKLNIHLLNNTHARVILFQIN